MKLNPDYFGLSFQWFPQSIKDNVIKLVNRIDFIDLDGFDWGIMMIA